LGKVVGGMHWGGAGNEKIITEGLVEAEAWNACGTSWSICASLTVGESAADAFIKS
jgi:hypothetical protein